MTPGPRAPLFTFGPFVLDPREGRLSRDGQPIALSGKALEMLTVLVSRAGQLVTREDLLQELWPDASVEDSNITVHVGTIRRALGDEAAYVETVPRLGYRFTAPVMTMEAPVASPLLRKRSAAGLTVLAGVLLILLTVWAVQRPPQLESFTVRVEPQEYLGALDCCNVAVTLDNGSVLLIAGAGHSPNPQDAADPWIFVSRAWILDARLRARPGQTGQVRILRESPSTTRLPDGRVLMAGGYGCPSDIEGNCRAISRGRVPLSSAHIYDPVANRATEVAGGMHHAHAGHTATLLGDGTVLIVGGYHGPVGSDDWGTAVQLFDPSAPEGAQFRLLDPISASITAGLDCETCRGEVRKADHTATLLPDGTVLIAGGWRGPSAAGRFDGALRYRPGDQGLTLASPTGRPFVRAASATATLLGDGRVLFAGGTRDASMAGTLEHVIAATMLYDPVTDTQTAGPALSVPRVGHSATAVSGHSVVFVGGMRCDFSVEQTLVRGPHDPTRTVCDANATGDIVTIDDTRSSVTTFSMFSGHAYHASTVLPDGRIYIPGGLVSPGRPTITAETIALTRR